MTDATNKTEGAAGDDPPAAADSGDPFARGDAPLYAVTIWPHRSMSPRGFRWLMIVLAAGLTIPLLSVWGTPVALFLLPFLLGALAFVWLMIRLNYRDGRLTEELRLWPDLVAVERREPRGAVKRWAANPHWVRVELADTPRLESYLTLSGGGRTIELGAFLSVDERVALANEVRKALGRARAPQAV